MQKVWYTSDLHFGHKNILKYNPDTRRHANADEMDEYIVNTWNSQVALTDIVYNLGDVSFHRDKARTKELLYRLNGQIHLIRGNHDKGLKTDRFEAVHDYHERRSGNIHIVMMHYPLAIWNKGHHGAIMLHGHSHGSFKGGRGRIMDVGWDAVGAQLISEETVIERLVGIPVEVLDHHTSETLE